MQKNQITIGGTYYAKVTDKVVPVRIDRENANGGWDATNLATNKKIKIKSAQRLRGEAKTDAMKAAKAVAKGNLADGITVPKSKPRSKKKLTAEERREKVRQANAKRSEAPTDKPKTTRTRSKVSLIDAAAQVLAETSEPMNTKELVDHVIEMRLWTPGSGKTPHATLYSAILREIKTKGDESRFVKAERGKFILAGKAA